MSNKISSTLIIVLLSSLFYFFPHSVSAVKDATSTDISSTTTTFIQELQKTIEQLQNQIKELQEQVTGLKSEIKEVKEELRLTKTLYKGLSDEEVKEVQKFLSQFREIYPEGLITGYFGSLTEKAIKKFQEVNDIPKTGTVGPLTRGKINEFLAEEEKEEKVIICHVPLGSPSLKNTLTIGESALEAHLAHGDAMGACPETIQPTLPSTPISSVPKEEKPTTTLPPISTPITSLTKIGPVAKIEAGGFHTCAIMTDKSLYCWGINDKGQLGDGTTQGRNTPVAVSGLSTGVSALAAGRSHTCALKTDGSVFCWGSNYNGQLGDGTFIDKLIPNPVPSLGPGTTLAISSGENHTCVLKSDKSVFCWGDNNNGQIGDGTTEGRLVPTLVQGLGVGSVSFIASGPRNSCAVKVDGSLVCWGSILFLVQNGTDKVTTPFLISGFSAGTISYVTVEHFHICVVRIDGSVACAGSNVSGQLGNGTSTSSVNPGLVNGLGAGTTVAVSAGRQFTCALKTDGSVVCWGWNANGQLGDGTVTNRYVPTSVTGLTTGTITAITTGDSHTCALKTDGSVICWGYNGSGQLGDGTNIDKRVPVSLVMSVAATTSSAVEECSGITGNSALIIPLQQQINDLQNKQQTPEIIQQISALQKQINCIKLLQ